MAKDEQELNLAWMDIEQMHAINGTIEINTMANVIDEELTTSHEHEIAL